ncbi:phosphoadenylyl-sulfate reductase [Chromobacterium subtsugae]|uniref:Adenosine 5'-phosphosulfate reductase n=1 Tax=Chromobacterium subtsugae TaxID=251747 RepID=A0ABS7FE11_9NEIS|nr:MULTISPECIES: phosphoadenylyl-sulfate reductase [Chromobacterium]KUM02391.1 phosphoadenosine phosphosulfate reductase [Chromobacterium subtsugae]KZE86834.1 phosphoadenosine phosphosulfate reductase [Chromobacterium sp. F49]MBW7566917.1 phosphoadenylyl-sulfate reductase [Chromobacterium subtsugae]MBW8288221.1 phosphoadenylyl-sulfate reductase [Chromobacterium subtsugae]OBU86624.1 phosphoadenosine phosphosulfate reductase [Chromobacterium subtsugae]
MSLESKLAATTALLKTIAQAHPDAALANSYGAEDMVLTDLIASLGLPLQSFSLDTGRLPAETYALMQQVAERYPGHPVRVYFPDTAATEQYVNLHGINGFYQSVDLRKSCCQVRKIEPLRRALAGRSAWITGLRREQSPTRQDLASQEYDADNGLQKFSPLLDWTEAEVWQYLRERQVPYNALHDRHYPSIGCAPCTRAISVGEDIRAGRWWWENPETKECGLHVKASPLQRPV